MPKDNLELWVESLDAETADLVNAIIERVVLVEREACAQVAERVGADFLSPEYAAGQPLSSFNERFACKRVAEEIRART